MAYVMGMAGSSGMLRRTLYEGSQFQVYTFIAIIGGSLVALGFIAFLVNLVATLGIRNVLSLVIPDRMLSKDQPAEGSA